MFGRNEERGEERGGICFFFYINNSMVTSAYEMEWKDSEGQEKNLNLGINIAVVVAYVTRWLFSFITEITHTHEGPSRRRDVPQDDDYVFPEYPRDKFQGDSSGWRERRIVLFALRISRCTQPLLRPLSSPRSLSFWFPVAVVSFAAIQLARASRTSARL